MYDFLKTYKESLKKTKILEKSLSHKYIAKYPAKNPRPGRMWFYVYATSWKKPFSCLKNIFGIGMKSITDTYKKGDIKKDYAASKKTWAAHILEYFTHKAKWDEIFSKKAARDAAKKPVKQSEVKKKREEKAKAEKKPVDPNKMLINRSLIRKAWSMYSAEGKKIDAAETSGEVMNIGVKGEKTNGAGNFISLANAIRDKSFFSVDSTDLGTVEIGWNTNGNGLKHIIERRFDETYRKGKGETDVDGIKRNITSLLFQIVENIKHGKPEKGKNENTWNISDKGVTAIVKRDNGKFLLTGFADKAKENEAAETISAVNAKYGYAPEFLDLYAQVGAAIASMKSIETESPSVKDTSALSEAMRGNKNAEGKRGGEKKENAFKFTSLTEKEKLEKAKKINGNIVAEIKKDTVPYIGDGRYGEAAREWIKNNPQGNAITEIGEVLINEKSVLKDMHHGAKADLYLKLQTLPCIKDVLEKGVYLGYEKDFDGKKIDNHFFAGKVKYGDEEKIVFCRVRENAGSESRFYVHEVFTEEEIKEEAFNAPTDIGLPHFIGKPLYGFILQNVLEVNRTKIEEKKDFEKEKERDNINNKRGEENESNSAKIESGYLSERNRNLRDRGREEHSSADGGNSGAGNDGNEPLQPVDESRNGLGRAETPIGVQSGRGRITKSEARDIRKKCREILKKPDNEITEADKTILRQYVGGGGTDEEGRSSSSVLYEYYTPRNVVDKIWQIVDKYNPRQDKAVIEPSCGIGRFAEGRNEKFTLFELEEESARIAKILNPDAEVVQGAFQENFIKQDKAKKEFSKYDVAVGNPPYGDYIGYYKGMGEGKEFKRYESYFMSRSLDTLKEKGILAMVIPSGFLDGKSNYGKDIERIAKKAKILEAYRLPNGIFDSTDVGTDIVVLQKVKEGSPMEDWERYFDKNPDNIMGEKATRNGRFGIENYIKLKDGDTFLSAVDKIKVEKPQEDSIASFSEEVKAEPEKSKKTEAEKKANRSRAMMGNKNAAGTHVMLNPNNKIMSASEFSTKYGGRWSDDTLKLWNKTFNNGFVDYEKLTQEEKDALKKNTDYVETEEGWQIKELFQSGDVRKKIKELNKNSQNYKFLKSLLEKVCPNDKKIGEFTINPLSEMAKTYKTEDGLSLAEGFLAWLRNGKSYFTMSDAPVSFNDLPPEISYSDIEDFIKRKSFKLSRSESLNDKAANEDLKLRRKQLRMETSIKLFNKYLMEGLSISDQKALEQSWNEKYNSYVKPDYSKIPISLKGMSSMKGDKDFTASDTQLRGVAELTTKGTGLLAFDVGVGKTISGLAATVANMQKGKCKKPLIIVPKPTYTNWIQNAKEMFPDIKINELGNLSKQYVKGEVEIEDNSISVCTYEALNNIQFSEEDLGYLLEDSEYALIHNDNDGDKKKSSRVAAKNEEKVMQFLGNVNRTGNTQQMYFDKLGFDHITVDEAHNFRNLFTNVKVLSKENEEDKNQSNEYGKLGGGQPSSRARKLFGISQLIQRKTGGNVFMLSATPFQNSPIEIYSMLSYIARDRLKELDLYSLEAFVSEFCKLKTEYVVKANKVENKQVVKEFNNLGKLQSLITEFIDKVDGEEAGVIRPEKQRHAPELLMNDIQKRIMEKCNQFIEKQEELPKKVRTPGYLFKAMNAMRQCALSPALVSDPEFLPDGVSIKPDEVVETSPKLKFVCDSIIKQYKQNSQNGQVMYMPSGVEFFPEVKRYLVRNGIPEEAIATLAGGATSDKEMDKRQEICDDFNDVNGKCKIIIGSSAIKEGVNLQGNSTTIYCTQLDWNPTDAQQLEGRIWRQGNKQGIVHMVYPLMYDTIDSMVYQKFDEKATRLNELFNYKGGDALNVEDINPEELKFELIKDPAKRAAMMVKEFEQKAKDNAALYKSLQDVLKKNASTAFASDDNLEELVRDKLHSREPYKSWFLFNLEKTETKVAQLTEKKKRLAGLIDECEKRFKEKHEPYTSQSANEMARKIEESGGHPWTRLPDYYDVISCIKGNIIDLEEDLGKFREKISQFKTERRKVFERRDTQKALLEKRSINNMQDAIKTIEEYKKLEEEALENVKKAGEKREEFYKKAVVQLESQKKNIPSLEKQIEDNVNIIMNNLHPMDAEWQEKIKAKNEVLREAARAKTMGKSFDFIEVYRRSLSNGERRGGKSEKTVVSWCCFDRNLNFYIRKSLLEKYRNIGCGE